MNPTRYKKILARRMQNFYEITYVQHETHSLRTLSAGRAKDAVKYGFRFMEYFLYFAAQKLFSTVHAYEKIMQEGNHC